MAIVGLTDRAPRFPRIGVLRKGAPKPNGSDRPGADLKHFRFTPESADAEGLEIAKLFEEEYGSTPTRINVYLPFATPDENLDTWKEEWSAGGLKHRCDGVTMVIWQDSKGMYHREPKACTGGCKEVGRLNVVIPELGRLALVTVLTTSKNDIMQLTSNLAAAYMVHGTLMGIPFTLTRKPVKVSTPTKDGRARREKWLLFLEPAHRWAVNKLKAMDSTTLLLPAGASSDPDIDPDEMDDVIMADIESGEIISPSEDHGKAEPTPEPAIISEEENAERIQYMKEIEAALPVVMVSESQLNVNAVKHAGVKDWRDANTAYLKGLAAKMKEQVQKKQESKKPEEVQA